MILNDHVNQNNMGKNKKQKKQKTMPRELREASPEALHGPGAYGHTRTFWQKIGDAWRRSFCSPREPMDYEDSDSSPEERNKTYDRAEDRAARQLATKMHDETPLMLEELVKGKIFTLESRVNDLKRSHDEVIARVDELWDAFIMKKPPNPLSSEPQPEPQRISLSSQQPNRTVLKENRYTLSSGSIKVEAVERVVCRLLGDESSTNTDVDALLSEIRRELGEVAISGESIGQRSKISVVWLTATGEGLALVDPGGLADAEVTKFFDVEFGRRVFRCLQPARVIRDGTELAVLRKGKVERL